MISKTDSERASEWYGRGRESKTSKRSVCFAVEMINKSSRVACATLGPRFPRAQIQILLAGILYISTIIVTVYSFKILIYTIHSIRVRFPSKYSMFGQPYLCYTFRTIPSSLVHWELCYATTTRASLLADKPPLVVLPLFGCREARAEVNAAAISSSPSI